jgi:hypothetical protein
MTLLALAALRLLFRACDTLVTNANGTGQCHRQARRFTGILIGDDGKVKRLPGKC